MKVILLFLALLSMPPMYAQTLSPAEAHEFARLLGEREILSKKGVKALAEAIDSKRLHRRRMPVFMEHHSLPSPVTMKELSRSVFLRFLSDVFAHEAVYRSGIMEAKKMMFSVFGKYEDRMTEPGIMDTINAEMALLAKEMEADEQQAPGLRLENAIRERTGRTKPLSYFRSKIVSFGSWDQHLMTTRFDGYGYIHDNRSALGITLEETLTDLREIGLLPTSIDLEEVTQVERYSKESDYLLYACAMTARIEDASLISQAQLAIADDLLKAGLIAVGKRTALTADIKANPFTKSAEFIPYLDNTLVIDLDKMSDDPETSIPNIFAKINEAYPFFGLTNPAWNVVVKEEYGTRQEVYTTSYKINGQPVTSKIAYRPIPDMPQEEAEDRVFPISYRTLSNGFNQWLRDRDDGRRFFYFSVRKYPEYYGDQTFALVLANKEQTTVLKRHLTAVFSDEDAVDSLYATADKDGFYTTLRETGLLDYLSEQGVEEARACWREKLTGSFYEVLDCYPGLLAEVGYGEMYEVETPYLDLTKAFATAGQDKFSPTTILDTYRESRRSNKTTYGFTLNGKEYRRELDIMGDWIDIQFVDLINEALADQNVDGTFYRYYEGMYILLTESQRRVLESLDPLMFEDDY